MLRGVRLSEPGDDFAERLLRRFLTWADDPRNQKRALRLCLGALGQGRSARAGFVMLNRIVLYPFLHSTGTRPSTARMELVAAQLFAIAMLRYRVRLEPIASMEIDELVPLYAPAIRAVLDAQPGERTEDALQEAPYAVSDLDPVASYWTSRRLG